MVSEIYACAYQEVIEVLKYTKKEDLMKIPKFKIELYMKYMNKENNFKIDREKPLNEQNVSNEAKAILANLYKDYWATDYEKERIEAKEKYDLEKIARENYNPDNMFKKKENIADTLTEDTIVEKNTSLLVIKKEKWYNKIFNSIKRFFGKDNPNNNKHYK